MAGNPHAAMPMGANPHATMPMPANPHAGMQAGMNGGAPTAAAPIQGNRLTVQGYAGPVPAGWTSTAPNSNMRVAQFALPAAPGSDGGEVAVFFFATGQGGTQAANIDRWSSQFGGSDGKPVAPKVEHVKAPVGDITLVELHGSYARGMGMGPQGEAKPNQTLVVAMVETPTGRITLQLYGHEKTVAAQRDGFLKLARGFQRPG
jgi:hypothetical protein